jgi:hypothetical protein
MTESSKSKLWRFAGLFLRLLLVTILCVFLSFFLCVLLHVSLGSGHIWQPVWPWDRNLRIIVFAFGYSWMIYHQLRLTITAWKRLLISIALGMVVTSIVWFIYDLLFFALCKIFNVTTV